MIEQPPATITAIVVADADRVQVEHIRAVVAAEAGLEIVGMTSRRDDAIDLFERLEPDVALIDVNLLSFCDRPLHGWGPISQDIRLVAIGPAEDVYLSSTLRASGFAAYVAATRIDTDLCDVLRGAAERPGGAGRRAPSLAR